MQRFARRHITDIPQLSPAMQGHRMCSDSKECLQVPSRASLQCSHSPFHAPVASNYRVGLHRWLQVGTCELQERMA